WHVAGRDHRQADAATGTGDAALASALTIAVLCNEATLTLDAEGGPQTTGSPTEAALLVAAHEWGVDATASRQRNARLATSPRADGRNWMGSLHSGPDGRLVAVKGAPEEVLRNSTRWMRAGGEAELDRAARRHILSMNDRMAGEGMRVL